MEFLVREIRRDEASLAQVFCVCQSSFPDISIAKLRGNWFDSSADSVFFGAYADDQLVGVNGFLAHRMLFDGVVSDAYQSCWSATSPSFRGKGLFSKIINHAKIALKGRASLICGFPNSVSGPIFTGKLGFNEVAMVRAMFIARGPNFVKEWQLNAERYFERLQTPRVVRFDHHALARWKQSEHGDAIIECEHNTNFLWGRLAKRRFLGVPVNTLLVGGCEINKPVLFGQLLRQVANRANASLVRMVCTSEGLVPAAARLVLSGQKTEPFIYFPVDMALHGAAFDAYTGMKDVF